MKTIPLNKGRAFQRFSVTLGETSVKFRLRWSTRHAYFTADLSYSDGTPIALGRGLHPGVNLLAGLNVNLGRIALEGKAPTLDNLGVANKLRWYPDE